MKDFSYCKKKDVKKWYEVRWKGYKFVFIFFPLVLIHFLYSKIERKYIKYINKRLKWNEEKAKIVLDFALPYALDYDGDKNEYYTSLGGLSYGLRKIPRKYRYWAGNFNSDIMYYLIKSYEKQGYTKTIENEFSTTWIIFKEKH